MYHLLTSYYIPRSIIPYTSGNTITTYNHLINTTLLI